MIQDYRPHRHNLSYGYSATNKKPKRKSKFDRRPLGQRISEAKIWAKVLTFILRILLLPFLPFVWILKKIFEQAHKSLYGSEFVIKAGFVFLFVAIVFRLAQLQIPAFANFVRYTPVFDNLQVSTLNRTGTYVNIARAKRGQIYIQDRNQGTDSIPVTNTIIQKNLFIDPDNLYKQIENGISLEEVIYEISANLNIPYTETYNKIVNELNKQKLSKFSVIYENLNEDQLSRLSFMRKNDSDLNKKFRFSFWLGVDQKQNRSYPEKEMLASTIGYTPNYMVGTKEIEQRFRQCFQMVRDNQLSGTDPGEYLVGTYGIEQKYCSVLGGRNGIQFSEEVPRIDGSDIYLTIDKNIQRQAENILAESIKKNTSEQGRPRDGSIIVMEAKTGKIRAMASWPTFDPNIYEDYWNPNSQKFNPDAFRNVATNVDYDPGSVMKPLTVAAALNVYQSEVYEDSKRKGIQSNFRFEDYDSKGKAYSELDGNVKYIRNANSRSYQAAGSLPLKNCIRDSINTCIADIVDETGARQLKSYFENRFKFGEQTAISLPGDEYGNTRNFEKDINCPICYANMGFGQGFTASPIQVIRAYSALANDGVMVEPYLVEKIKHQDGSIDTGISESSIIRKEANQRVLREDVSNLMKEYMVSVIDEGFLGEKPSPAKVNGYTLAGKTGTSEVNRPIIKKDINGKPLVDAEGKIISEPCDYRCNREKGIYDHSFVGFGPVDDPQFIVLVKISEPNKGEVQNFSSTTTAAPFGEIMEYVLSYYNVPRKK